MANLLEEGSDVDKSFCFICDQLIDLSSNQNDFDKFEKNLETCHKFCTLVSRFLHFSCDESLGNFKERETLDLKSGNEILDMEQQMCDPCFHKAEKFCDLYDVWTKVKLELNEGVKDMAGLMNVCDSNGTETGKPGFLFRQIFVGQVQNRLQKCYPQLKLERLEIVEITNHDADNNAEPEPTLDIEHEDEAETAREAGCLAPFKHVVHDIM